MRSILCLLLSLAALPTLAANIYKWTDAQGQIHYSQTPPPHGPVKAQAAGSVQPGVSVQATVPPTPAVPAAKVAAAVDAKAAVPETKADRNKRCSDSKERLAFLEEHTAHRLFVKDSDGNEARMTEEQFTARLAKARDAGKGC